MEKWYCFKCKEEMKPASVEMEYLGLSGPTECIKCPKCGAIYLTEEIVIEKVLKTQEMIEAKVR